MLSGLRIRQVAVIESLELELGAGLTVLTGETGAGKSIIVDTLNLLLGARASADLIRAGAEEATVEARFDIAGDRGLVSRLAEMGVEGAEEGELVVKRVLSRTGRSRTYLNGGPATAAMLAGIGDRLVAIAGQHESQRLLRPETHLDLLDAYARLGEPRRAYTARADVLRHQLEELRAAALDPDEEERLQEERRLLASAEKRRAAAEAAHELLYGAEDSAVAKIGEALESARGLARLDPSQDAAVSDLEAALRTVEELGVGLRDYASAVDAEAGRLDEVETRLALLARLKRRHGVQRGRRLRRGGHESCVSGGRAGGP